FLQVGFAGLPVLVKERAAVGHAGIGAGISRVEYDGACKHLAGIIEALPPELVEELAAAQVVIVSLHVAGLRLLDGLFFLLAQHHSQLARNVLSNLILDGENIFQLAVVALRPNRKAVARVDELRGNAQAIAGAPQAATQHISRVKLLPDLRGIDGTVAEGQYGGAREDAQT